METDKRAYRVLFFAWLGWFINFADRQLLSPLLPLLQKEFHLSNTDIGLLTSAFFIGYSISPIPGGYLADKYGSKKIIAFSILFFGISTFFTGLAGGVIGLLVVRATTGLFEGAYYSSAVGYVTSVFPRSKRAFASAIFSTGWTLGSFAGILFATAVGLLAWNFSDALVAVFTGSRVEAVSSDWRSPWQWMLIPTILAAILTYFFMPEIPMHERAAFQETGNSGNNHSFSEILKNRNVWIIFSLQFVANFGLWSISTFTPKYFSEVKGFSLVVAGGLTALMFLPGTIGSILSGKIGDMIGRRLTITLFYSLSGLLWYGVLLAKDVQSSFYMIALAGFFITGLYPTILAWMTDSVSAELSARATGFGIMGAELGAFTTPIISGFLADKFGMAFSMNIFIWTYVFGGLIVWLGSEKKNP